MHDDQTPVTVGAHVLRNAEGDVRAVWKLSLYFGIFFIGMFVLLTVVMIELRTYFLPLLSSMTFLIAAASATVLTGLVTEERAWPDVGFTSRFFAWHWSAGLLIAAAMIAIAVLAGIASGLASVRPAPLDSNWFGNIIIVSFAFDVLVGIAEELLLRGYPFQVLLRTSNQWTALLVTSIIFSLLHVGNPGITPLALFNLFLAGVWLGRARIVSGGLWLPIGMHTAWNFIQESIFGIPDPRMMSQGVFRTALGSPSWLTGGAAGLEGGLFFTAAVLLGIGAFSVPRIAALIKHTDDPADA